MPSGRMERAEAASLLGEESMARSTLRVGLIGAGANTKARHIPGLRAIEDVEIIAVCNRRLESSDAVAREYGIGRIYERWQDLLGNPDIDAVVIGTWPYLHRAITLAALESGKHVLTEARLALNAAEAHEMLAASRRHPELVTQIVPSPYGLAGDRLMKELLESNYLGKLREVRVYSMLNSLADPAAPLSWRQDAALSGFNMLNLGIIHETLLRWLPPPVRVMAQVHAFIPSRIDPQSGVRRAVGTPDSVQVLAVLENGGRASYHFSGVTSFGQGAGVWLYGTEGVLHYDLKSDRIRGGNAQSTQTAADELEEIPIPPEKALSWQVEADFIDSIRTGAPVRFTDFTTGVAYMEFTEAVARSAERGEPIDLPLEEFADHDADD
jgi:predicted dehydrogenase